MSTVSAVPAFGYMHGYMYVLIVLVVCDLSVYL